MGIAGEEALFVRVADDDLIPYAAAHFALVRHARNRIFDAADVVQADEALDEFGAQRSAGFRLVEQRDPDIDLIADGLEVEEYLVVVVRSVDGIDHDGVVGADLLGVLGQLDGLADVDVGGMGDGLGCPPALLADNVLDALALLGGERPVLTHQPVAEKPVDMEVVDAGPDDLAESFLVHLSRGGIGGRQSGPDACHVLPAVRFGFFFRVFHLVSSPQSRGSRLWSNPAATGRTCGAT